MKSSVENPRVYDASMKGWEVDLARDYQTNCEGCDAPMYMIYIRTKQGVVKRHPISEHDMGRRPCPDCSDGQRPNAAGTGRCPRCNNSHVIVFGVSHYSDCSERERFGGTPVKP